MIWCSWRGRGGWGLQLSGFERGIGGGFGMVWGDEIPGGQRGKGWG